jgi:hypothetical protein
MFATKPQSTFRTCTAMAALVIVGLVLLNFSITGFVDGQLIVRSRGAASYIAYAAGPHATAFMWNAWGTLALGITSLTYGLVRCARFFRRP